MLTSLILRLALVYAASVIAECCFKSSSSNGDTAATGSPGASASIGQPTSVSTSSPTSNRQPCTLTEEQVVDCLNGGTCFAIKSPASPTQRILSCACTPDWSGPQCENRNFMSGASVQQAGTSALPIVLGIVGCVVLVTVVVVAVIFIRPRKPAPKTKKPKSEKPTCAQQQTIASYTSSMKALNTVDACQPYTAVFETSKYNFDQPVDGSQELAERDAHRGTPDVVPNVVCRAYSPFNPIILHPFADQQSGLGDTSLLYSESIYSRNSRTSAFSQNRQHETSI